MLGAVGPPDFGERGHSPGLGAEHWGLGLSVDVEVGVRRAVQGTEPLGSVGLGLGQLGEGRREQGSGCQCNMFWGYSSVFFCTET